MKQRLDELFAKAKIAEDRKEILDILDQIGEIFSHMKVIDCLKYESEFYKIIRKI